MFKKIIAIILLVVCFAGCGIYGSKANKRYNLYDGE